MDIDPRLINGVKGFMDPEEGTRLYEAALEAGRMGPCLEIGSYCGKSALYIGSACRKNGSVLFSIDHHRGSEEQQPGQEYFDPELVDPSGKKIDTFPHFRQVLESAGLEETVVPLVCRSHVAARWWRTPLAMVFIDGGHAFETVHADYSAWVGHIVPGGLLLIHDLFEKPEDGGQAPYDVYRLALASGLFQEIDRCKSLGVLRRHPALGILPHLPR
ncbi:MAG: class I SAM-dependent methyltransferase [Desulfobacterales bacterium]|nr:class I SAM-dependent methyltransferase [Desulfobacterales bacterium]